MPLVAQSRRLAPTYVAVAAPGAVAMSAKSHAYQWLEREDKSQAYQRLEQESLGSRRCFVILLGAMLGALWFLLVEANPKLVVFSMVFPPLSAATLLAAILPDEHVPAHYARHIILVCFLSSIGSFRYIFRIHASMDATLGASVWGARIFSAAFCAITTSMYSFELWRRNGMWFWTITRWLVGLQAAVRLLATAVLRLLLGPTVNICPPGTSTAPESIFVNLCLIAIAVSLMSTTSRKRISSFTGATKIMLRLEDLGNLGCCLEDVRNLHPATESHASAASTPGAETAHTEETADSGSIEQPLLSPTWSHLSERSSSQPPKKGATAASGGPRAAPRIRSHKTASSGTNEELVEILQRADDVWRTEYGMGYLDESERSDESGSAAITPSTPGLPRHEPWVLALSVAQVSPLPHYEAELPPAPKLAAPPAAAPPAAAPPAAAPSSGGQHTHDDCAAGWGASVGGQQFWEQPGQLRNRQRRDCRGGETLTTSDLQEARL